MLRIDPGLKEELLERIEKRTQEQPSTGGVIRVKSRVIHHLQMKAKADGFQGNQQLVALQGPLVVEGRSEP